MRASTALNLLPACCGFLLSWSSMMPAPAEAVFAKKAIFDYRSGEDFGTAANCVNAETDKTRYLQIELFDYNQTPDLHLTWRQISDECGNPVEDPFEASMSWAEGDVSATRLQMDMYICAPWGNYEMIIKCKSTNGGNPMERIAWEVEYGPKEYHIWDTLNTPFFREEPASDYAPIPKGDGVEQIFKFPLEGSEAYYSLLYSGPFPPLECPNLHPPGVDYVGCYDAGLFGTADGPTGSVNDADPAEPYRMFDGIDDAGVDEDGVMTLEKCASMCTAQGTKYFGLESAIKCLCGDELDDSLYPDVPGVGGSVCGVDYTTTVNIPEYKFLCSGDSRVLCGTDDHISVYSLGGSTGAPAEGEGFSSVGCVADSMGSGRVMEIGPIEQSYMSAEVCMDLCLGVDPDTTFFGTQYGNECFCTKDLGATSTSSKCTMDCAKNDGEICGGNLALSVYEIATVDPTPAPVDDSEDGFSLVGCLEDGPDDRVMTAGPFLATPMSAEICLEMCLDMDASYTHFGTQFGKECFCTGELLTSAASSDACSMPCNGNEDEICGGFFAISVYEVDGPANPTLKPADEDTLTAASGEGYVSLGCHADLNGDRIMGEDIFATSTVMTGEVCYDLCNDGSNTHFGTQYGVECFCGVDPALNKHGGELAAESHCLMACAGDSGESCGGFDEIDVYEIEFDYTALGCFHDPDDGSRAMELKITQEEMSAEICYNLCVDEDPSYEFFGTQWSNECWCSKTFSEPIADDAVCDSVCANNGPEVCGGFYVTSAYSIN